MEESSTPQTETNPSGEKSNRVNQGVILQYDFNEGSGATVNDTSGFLGATTDTTALNMTIFNENLVRWLDGGLHIDGPVEIKSFEGGIDHPAGKIQSAVESTEEVTIEAWLRPANITQGGTQTPPVCIFTYAGDTTTHNFMLAQDGDSYVVDFRTTDTNAVNSKGQPSLPGPVGSATMDMTHLVVTWSSASARLELYINGVWAWGINRTGNVYQGWEAGLPLRLGYELDTDGSTPVSTWQGDVYLLAMYDRLLSEDEILQNYKAGY